MVETEWAGADMVEECCGYNIVINQNAMPWFSSPLPVDKRNKRCSTGL